jgi:hypothetical protein
VAHATFLTLETAQIRSFVAYPHGASAWVGLASIISGATTMPAPYLLVSDEDMWGEHRRCREISSRKNFVDERNFPKKPLVSAEYENIQWWLNASILRHG